MVGQLVWIDMPARRKPFAELAMQKQQGAPVVDDEGGGREVACHHRWVSMQVILGGFVQQYIAYSPTFRFIIAPIRPT